MGLKDIITSAGIKKVINGYLTGIGEVDKFDLDQKQKSMHLSVNLIGEEKPVDIIIGRYELMKQGDSLFIRILDLSSSRKWIEAAVKKYAGGPILVPSEYAGLVEKIL